MTAVKRKPTVAAGAVIERALIHAWIERQEQTISNDRSHYAAGYTTALDALSMWLKAQPQRTRRAGGIGR